MRLSRLLSSALALALLGFGLQAAQAQDKIRLGILPFSESLGAVMADKLGYFKAEGLEVEMSRFNSGALALPLLQAGKLDITFNNTVATLQAMEQGMDVAFIAPGAVVRTKAPDTTAALITLKGSIKSPKDFEGKRVAVNVINKQVDAVGVSEPFATVLLDTGLAETVTYVYVDSQPNGDITQYISLAEW